MARNTLVRGLLLTFGLALLAAQGCADQGEGERCEPLGARDADCDDGLVCLSGDQLGETYDDGVTAVDFGRCCPPDGTYSDQRCAPTGSLGIDGGVSGSGGMSAAGTGGMAGEAGAPSGGAGAGGEPAGGASGAGGEPAGGASGAGGEPAGGVGGEPAMGGMGGMGGA